MVEQENSNSSPLTVLGAAAQLQKLGTDPSDKPDEEAEESADAAPAAEASASEEDAETPADSDADADADEAEDEEEATADDDAASAKPDDVVFEVEHEGKKVPVTREEARLGHLRQQDYTKKTQAVAEERKAVEADRATIKTSRAQYAAGLAEIDGYLKQIVGQEPDWDKVRAEQPSEYPRLHADWQVTKQRLGDLQAERGRVAKEQQDEFNAQLKVRVIEEAQKFGAAVPEFLDPVKGKALQGSLLDYGQHIGFTSDEIGNTLDHRLLIVLNKARLYDDLQAQKPTIEAKKKVLVPKTPTLKPGATRQQSTNSRAKEQAAAIARSARTGRSDDAAEAIRLLG